MSANCDSQTCDELGEIVSFLCARRHFGYAQLDEAFCALWRHGDLARWIEPGKNVCTATELFFGLERELLNLQDEDGACLVLPRVGLSHLREGEDDEGPSKISVEAFWDDAAQRYHVVIHRLTGASEVELELLKQIRARRLAEQHVDAARQQLAQQQTLLNVLMEEAPVALALFDTDMRYLLATRRWAKDFGVECQPFIGHSHYEMGAGLPGDARGKHEACLAGATLPPEVTEIAGKPPRWVRWTHKGWRRRDGTAGGVLTTAEDMTATMETRRELERANGQLRDANCQLEQFASILAHDFNAPLASMETAINELGEGDTAAANLRLHVARLKGMLAGLNDYCRSGVGGQQAVRVDVGQLVAEIAATQQRRDAFRIEFHAAQPEIEAPPAALDLVLRNLIGNAIKHHDRETGLITVSLTEESDVWILEVADDGPGIAPAHHAAIFEPFTRLQTSRNECQSGHGMGLAIVKRAVDGAGATIQVKSLAPIQRGTVFSVQWPRIASCFSTMDIPDWR